MSGPHQGNLFSWCGSPLDTPNSAGDTESVACSSLAWNTGYSSPRKRSSWSRATSAFACSPALAPLPRHVVWPAAALVRPAAALARPDGIGGGARSLALRIVQTTRAHFPVPTTSVARPARVGPGGSTASADMHGVHATKAHDPQPTLSPMRAAHPRSQSKDPTLPVVSRLDAGRCFALDGEVTSIISSGRTPSRSR